MQYLLLLYGDAEAEDALSADDRRAIMEEHVAFSARLRDAGAHVAGAAIHGASSGKLVRPARGSRPLVTDGPFTETKEQLGGFYLLECADLEEAVEWAGRVPPSPGLVVKIRQVVD